MIPLYLSIINMPAYPQLIMVASEPIDIIVECCKVHTPLQNSALNAAEWDDSGAKASPSVNGNEVTYDVSSLDNSINKPGLKIGCKGAAW